MLKLKTAAAVTLVLLACGHGPKSSLQPVPVTVSGKDGFIDRTGKVVIQPQFAQARAFAEGLALVKVGGTRTGSGPIRGGKWGYIDQTGKFVIPAQFEWAGDFSEGLALTAKVIRFDTSRMESPVLGNYRYINKQGGTAFDVPFDRAFAFSEGRAAVATVIERDSTGRSVKSKWGFIDQTGKTVIEPRFDAMGSIFAESLCPVLVDGKWGYIDRAGKMAIEPRFPGAAEFSEGLAPADTGGQLVVRGRPGGATGGKWGLIDRSGKFVIAPQYDMARSFSEGLAAVRIGDKNGYVDRTGKMVI